MALSFDAAFTNCDRITDDNDSFDIQCSVYDKRTFVRRDYAHELTMGDDPFVDNDVGEYLSQGQGQPMYFVDGLTNVSSNDRTPQLLNSNLEQFNETTAYTEIVEIAPSYESRLMERGEASPDIFIHEYSTNQYLNTSPDLFESTPPQILGRNTSPDIFNDSLENDKNIRISKHTIADDMQLAATPDISIHEINPIHVGVVSHRANNNNTEMSLIIENKIGHMPNLSVNDLHSMIQNASFNSNGTHPSASSFFIIRDEPTDSERMNTNEPRGTSQCSHSHSPDIFDNQNDDNDLPVVDVVAYFNEINVPNQNSAIQSQTLSPDIFEAYDNDEVLAAVSNETEPSANGLGNVVVTVACHNVIQSLNIGQSTTHEPNNDAVPQQLSQTIASTVRSMETNSTSRSQANEEYAARAYQNILLNQALVDNNVEMAGAINAMENHQIDMNETHLTIAS